MSTKVTECKTVLKPDYKNWMPRGMIWSFVGGTVLSLALCFVAVNDALHRLLPLSFARTKNPSHISSHLN